MDKQRLERSIEHLFCFWPSDSEEIVEVINDLIDFIEQILGKDSNIVPLKSSSRSEVGAPNCLKSFTKK